MSKDCKHYQGLFKDVIIQLFGWTYKVVMGDYFITTGLYFIVFTIITSTTFTAYSSKISTFHAIHPVFLLENSDH